MKQTKVSEVLKEARKQAVKEDKSVVDIYLENKDALLNSKSIHRKEWEGRPEDLAYNAEILSFRYPGMGNAIHIIKGVNPLSIMTLQMSIMQQCIAQGIYTVKDLEDMVETVKKDIENKIDKEG